RLPELFRGDAAFQWWQGIGPGSWPFERVAAGQDLPAKVARPPRDPDVVLGGIVERFEILIGERPVLDGRALGQAIFPISLDVMRAVDEVAWVEPPGFRRPVNPGPAKSLSRMKRPMPPHGQRWHGW